MNVHSPGVESEGGEGSGFWMADLREGRAYVLAHRPRRSFYGKGVVLCLHSTREGSLFVVSLICLASSLYLCLFLPGGGSGRGKPFGFCPASGKNAWWVFCFRGC